MTYRVTVARELSYANASDEFQRRPLREKVQCSCRGCGVITDDRICKHGGAVLYRCCMASELPVRFLDDRGDVVYHRDNFRELAGRTFGPVPGRGLAPEEAFRPVDGVVRPKGPPNRIVPMPSTLYRGMGYPGEAVLDDIERVRERRIAEEVALRFGSLWAPLAPQAQRRPCAAPAGVAPRRLAARAGWPPTPAGAHLASVLLPLASMARTSSTVGIAAQEHVGS